MRGEFVACFLVLAISVNFESCKAQEVSSSTPLANFQPSNGWKKSNQSAFNYLDVLSAELSNFTENLEKNKASPKVNILETIHTNADYISLKTRLDKTFPDFWNVSKRRKCTTGLDTLVNRFLERYQERKQDCDKTMIELSDTLWRMKNYIDSASWALTLNKQENLEVCKQDAYCKVVNRNVNKFEEEMESVKNKLNWISNYNKTKRNKDSVAKIIELEIILPVRNCLESI